MSGRGRVRLESRWCSQEDRVTSFPAVSSVPDVPRYTDPSGGISPRMSPSFRSVPPAVGSRGSLAGSVGSGSVDRNAYPSSPRATVTGPRPNSLHPEAPVRRPDHAQIILLRDAFWLLGDVDLLSQRFDARLACMTPRAEGAFVQLFPRGAERFVTVLLRAVDALGADPAPQPGTDAEAQLRALAVRLLSAGMRPADFLHVGSSLYRAIRDSYTGEWTDDLDRAWTVARDWLVARLQAVDKGADPAGVWATQRSVADLELAARLDRLAASAS